MSDTIIYVASSPLDFTEFYKEYFTQRRREITHLGVKTQVDLTGEPKRVQMVSPCDEGQEVLKGKISLVV